MFPLSHRILTILAALALAGCKSAPSAADPTADLPARLQALIDSAHARQPTVPGIALRVEAPAIGFSWAGATGVADRATGEKLRPEHTFRVASNTKTYVAAAILRLAEDGQLALGDPIAKHISPASTAALKRGGYDPATITVRDLLQHVSGIFDYAMDDGFSAAIFTRPTHRWTRAEQLDFAVKNGKPYGKPREVYHYSDTGYILLGEILERTTGQPLGAAVASQVGFDRLGLKTSWFETLDSIPAGAGPRAHQYADSVDTNPFDPSFDLYGGGGIVADMKDLAGFYRALLAGQVFRAPATLDTMLAVTPQSVGDDSTRGYGMGIGRRKPEGIACYGHGGFWGSMAVSCPEVGLTVAVAMNHAPNGQFDPGAVVAEVVRLMKPVLAASKPAP